MSFLKKILHYAGFGKKDEMANPGESEPSNVLSHRYQDPQVLLTYVKSLPDGFTGDDITVKPLKDRNGLGLWLPRKLEKEEIEGASKAFVAAERARRKISNK